MTAIKIYLKPLITGIVVTLIMAIIMLKITMDFQFLLFVGAIIFFIAGLINFNTKRHNLVAALLVSSIYLVLFITTVLAEIPKLWYFVPIYFSASFLGLFFKNHKQKTIASLSVLTIAMLFLSIETIPKDLEESLTHAKFEQLPQFKINDVSGNIIDTKSFQDKVVVLSFFGTWCKPCIQELQELDKIQKTFKDHTDVEFYVINANLGGDTLEKFNAFIEQHNYNFKYAYDHNSELFKLLNLQQFGLPTLLIIDKGQNIRIQHVGYNTAETNFTTNMIKTINELK